VSGSSKSIGSPAATHIGLAPFAAQLIGWIGAAQKSADRIGVARVRRPEGRALLRENSSKMLGARTAFE
jgi:hypothetical protein